ALTGRSEQRLIDERAGESADLRADGRATDRGAQNGEPRRKQRAACSATRSSKSESCHQSLTPGNEKTAAVRLRHHGENDTSATGALSMAWMIVASVARIARCFAGKVGLKRKSRTSPGLACAPFFSTRCRRAASSSISRPLASDQSRVYPGGSTGSRP